jgi:hypothetical protein
VQSIGDAPSLYLFNYRFDLVSLTADSDVVCECECGCLSLSQASGVGAVSSRFCLGQAGLHSAEFTVPMVHLLLVWRSVFWLVRFCFFFVDQVKEVVQVNIEEEGR